MFQDPDNVVLASKSLGSVCSVKKNHILIATDTRLVVGVAKKRLSGGAVGLVRIGTT